MTTQQPAIVDGPSYAASFLVVDFEDQANCRELFIGGAMLIQKNPAHLKA